MWLLLCIPASMESKFWSIGTHHVAYCSPLFLIIFLFIASQLTKGVCAADQALHIVIHVPFWGLHRLDCDITPHKSRHGQVAYLEASTGMYTGHCTPLHTQTHLKCTWRLTLNNLGCAKCTICEADANCSAHLCVHPHADVCECCYVTAGTFTPMWS